MNHLRSSSSSENVNSEIVQSMDHINSSLSTFPSLTRYSGDRSFGAIGSYISNSPANFSANDDEN